MNFPSYHFNSDPISIVQYKNCIFQGQIEMSMKQKTGILITDDGQIVITNFLNDQISGETLIFLNSSTYVIGSFTRGMLDGKFVLRNEQLSIYWMVRMNKIIGQIIVINYERMNARIWMIENGEGHCLQQIDIKQTDKENDIINILSPNTRSYNSPVQFLCQKFGESLRMQPNVLNKSIRICLQTKSNQTLRLTLFKQKIVQYGLYFQKQLNGPGYILQGLNVLQGKFKNGKLDGYGLKWEIDTKKIIYGSFKNGDIRSIDILTDNQNQAKKQLKNYKKQQHIYSLNYMNNYFNQRPILMLLNFLTTMQENDRKFTQQMQNEDNFLMRTKNRSRQSQEQKQESRFSVIKRKNLTSFGKQRFEDKGLVSDTKSQNYVSRFVKMNKNLGFNNTVERSQFHQGIDELNRINKALRKFK